MRIGVIGLGYVGLPLAVEFAEAGHEVIGVDTSHARLAALERGESHVEDVSSERIAALGDRLRATSRYDDEHVPELGEYGLASESLDAALEGADVAAIVTAHPGLDVERVVRTAPLVVDFRGVTRGLEASNLVRL